MNRPKTNSRRRALACALLAALSTGPAFAASTAYLSKTSGLVQWKKSGSADWDNVSNVPQDLDVQDSVRTGSRAQATLMFGDGSRIELGPNASFQLEAAEQGKSGIKLNFGWIKAFVQHIGNRKFQVRTPNAVCSVRGTEFRVEVDNGGRTTVDLYKGLLGVEDRRGQQVLLHPNERLQIDLRGIGRPSASPSRAQIQKSQFHNIMQREMALDMSKAEVLASAAREIKLAEFQQGKALIDAFGKRVRLEEYIIRPQPDQFKLVVLNERQSRFDYFYYLGTFNTTLPSDLRLALSQLGGTVGAPPTWWLTSFEKGSSNTQDSLVEKGTGGHPVDINHTADPSEQVNFLFNPQTDSFQNVTGQNMYVTLFDNYGLYINGGLKYGWTGNNIQTYTRGLGAISPVSASNNDPITGAALAAPVSDPVTNSTFPDPNSLHQVVYQSFQDGSYIQFDNFIISDQGKTATPAQFAASLSGVSFSQGILNWNYEQVITASEFQGRKIDLVIEPKIIVQSGLLGSVSQ